MIKREEIDKALIAMLRSGSGKQVGDGQAPDDRTFPYAMLFSITGVLDGPMGAAEADAELTYQVTSVGRDRYQAQAMSTLVRRVLTGHDGSLNYDFPLVIPDHAVQWRRPSILGAAVQGGTMFSVVDEYIVKVSVA